MLCEMLSVSPRIWTLVAMSISYDDNHYTTTTYHPSHKLSTLDEPDMRDTAGEVGTN